MKNRHQRLIIEAVDTGIERYLQSRKAKVPAFVAKHFSFKGALKLHRKALGKDLYKVPLNILWSAPMTAVKACAWLCNKTGAKKAAHWFDRVPAGFKTDVQQEINWLIYTELLELPYQQGDRITTKDALLETILQDQALTGVIEAYLTELYNKTADPDYARTLEKNLEAFAGNRLVATDLAGSLITLASSYIALNKATPGAISAGTAAATVLAEKIAIAQFWLGPTLGAWYYGLFPVAASTGLVVATTGAVMAGLALLSTLAGIITDPLQAKLGWHQKQLNTFIDALGAAIKAEYPTKNEIKTLYINRVFDILDVLVAALRS